MPQIRYVEIYTSATYTLNLEFDKNGGDSAPAAVHASTTSNAASVSVYKAIPAELPTRAGYSFIGYSVGENDPVSKQPGNTIAADFSRSVSGYTEREYQDGNTTVHERTYHSQNQSRTKKYYAQWQTITYNVTFDANGGTDAPATQAKTHGEDLALSAVIPVRDGHTFTGWATSPSGSPVYQPGDTYSTDADVVLYAVWVLSGSPLDSVSSSVDVGSSGLASWTPLDPSYIHELILSYGDAPDVSVETAAGVTSATFTIPATWYAAMPNVDSGLATATLCTYDGDTLVGTSSKTFTVTVPSGVKPTISSFTAAHYSENATVSGWGEFTQGFSQADLSVSAAAGNGATITSISFSGPGIDQTGASATARTAVLGASKENTFTVMVTDSRGRSATETLTVYVYPYSPPTVLDIITMRAESDGTINNGGGLYMKVETVYGYSHVNEKNSLTTKTLSYCAHGAGTPAATINPCASGTLYGPPGVSWQIDLDDAYDVTVTLTDALGSTVTGTVTLPPATGIWYGRGNDRIGLGKVPEGPGLWVDWDAAFKGNLDVVKRRCSKMVESTTGWFRVLAYDAGILPEVMGASGFVIDFTITRDGIVNETHKVSLFSVYNDVTFTDETSVSKTQRIDKIRYTYNASTMYGYVDIHLNTAPQSVVTVDFSVKTKPIYQGKFCAADLSSVSNTPSGETVLATYDFSPNGTVFKNLIVNTYKTLWTGVWASGDITVDEINDFNLFLVKTSDGESDLICTIVNDGTNSYLRGVGGYASASSKEMMYYLSAVLSGTTLTMEYCRSVSSSTSRTSRTVTEIVGISLIGGTAQRPGSIHFGQVDGTSTSTAYTAHIDGISAYYDGLTVMLKNGVVTSAAGFTIDINGLGAKQAYSNMAAATAESTIFNVNYTMLFVYDSTRVEGGGWVCYRGYDSNTNTIGYQLRTNSSTLPMADVTYRYRLLFSSADGEKWVPATKSTSTNATSKRDVNQTPIDPFGPIVYYGTTASVAAGSAPAAANLWQQYTLTLGYSFNRVGAALSLTFPAPVFVKCATQADGSAIMDATTPFVQSLPTTDDGKIYILLGRAYSATAIELLHDHPVYCFRNGSLQLYTGPQLPLPPITANDEGKVLKVVGGIPTWVTP